jgi:hypothetical protein
MNYDRSDQLNPWLRGTWTSDYLPQEFFYKENRFGRFVLLSASAASILVLAAANSLTPAVTFRTTAEAAMATPCYEDKSPCCGDKFPCFDDKFPCSKPNDSCPCDKQGDKCDNKFDGKCDGKFDGKFDNKFNGKCQQCCVVPSSTTGGTGFLGTITELTTPNNVVTTNIDTTRVGRTDNLIQFDGIVEVPDGVTANLRFQIYRASSVGNVTPVGSPYTFTLTAAGATSHSFSFSFQDENVAPGSYTYSVQLVPGTTTSADGVRVSNATLSVTAIQG